MNWNGIDWFVSFCQCILNQIFDEKTTGSKKEWNSFGIVDGEE